MLALQFVVHNNELKVQSKVTVAEFESEAYENFFISVSSFYISYLGLVISGGAPSDSAAQSVEVYVPSTGQHCLLPDLPDRRDGHTMEKMTVCGGGGYNSDTETSCITLTGEGWENTTTLLEQR